METGTAIISAAILATIGWYVTSRYTQVISRRQHSFQVYDSYRNNKDFHTHRKRAHELVEAGDIPSCKDASRKADIESIDWLLNHYEFICGAILTGDLDERIFKRWEFSRIKNISTKFRDYIDENREKDDQPTLWESLDFMADRWITGAPVYDVQQIYEFVMLRPYIKDRPWFM